jgi:hypothetical protein
MEAPLALFSYVGKPSTLDKNCILLDETVLG